MLTRICIGCNKEFSVKFKSSTKKYCNLKCACQLNGGYRSGSGRAKSGYYKGFYCGSTWELCWLIFQLDHNKNVLRFPGILEFDGIKYIPDFLQDGKIIEIKGYEDKISVDRKTEVAQQNGYSVEVLRFEALKECFAYVKNTYNTSDFASLYDESKYQYKYICECCGKDFVLSKRRKAERIACSRSCSMKLNRKSSGKNKYSTLREAAGVGD